MKPFKINFKPDATLEQKLEAINLIEKNVDAKFSQEKQKKLYVIFFVASAVISLLFIFFGKALNFTVLGSETSLKFNELSTYTKNEDILPFIALSALVYKPYIFAVIAQVACLYFIVKGPLNDKTNKIVLIINLATCILSALLFLGAIYSSVGVQAIYSSSSSYYNIKTTVDYMPAVICFILLLLNMFPLVFPFYMKSLKKQISILKADLTK